MDEERKLTCETPREMDIWMQGFNCGVDSMKRVMRDLNMLEPKPSLPADSVVNTYSPRPDENGGEGTAEMRIRPAVSVPEEGTPKWCVCARCGTAGMWGLSHLNSFDKVCYGLCP